MAQGIGEKEMIYLAENSSRTLLKIGCSIDPMRRYLSLSRIARNLFKMSEESFRITHLLSGGKRRERKILDELHHLALRKRVAFEWFPHDSQVVSRMIKYGARAVYTEARPLWLADAEAKRQHELHCPKKRKAA